MEDFALEGLMELYKQEKKKLEELESKEIEKALCEAGVELLKDIELPADNPALTLAAEEKYHEFFARKKGGFKCFGKVLLAENREPAHCIDSFIILTHP